MGKIKLGESPFSKIDHIGVIVSDMNRAIEHYQSLGIGPFEHVRNLIIAERKVLGKPVKLDDIQLEVRIAKMGQIDFELIQPVAGESLWKEFLESKGEGVNHVGCLAENIDKETAKLEEKGLKVLYSSRFKNGGGAAYFDTAEVGGIILELVQWPPP